MKKKVQKIQRNKSYSADHVSVILEEVKGMMMTFGEGQDVLSDKVDRMQGDITEIRGDITEIRGDITEMRGDITEMRGDITEMRGDITEMRGDITRIQDDVTDIKHTLSDKVDRSEFERLEKRVIKVERVVLSKRA